MTAPADQESDAAFAAACLAVDPAGLGGLVLRGSAGPARERWMASLRAVLAADVPVLRIPPHVAEERLIGGLDLAATLADGRPMFGRGLLAASDGGLLVLPMAERVGRTTAAHLAAALDAGAVAGPDGAPQPARIAVVALDEGIEPDETVPAALRDRLAISVELPDRPQASDRRPPDIATARARLPSVRCPEDGIASLTAAAHALGIGSLRAPTLALRLARVAAALADREVVTAEDLAAAGRLVLAPRATRIPTDPADPADAPSDAHSEPEPETRSDQTRPAGEGPVEDIVLAAAAAAIPPGLLAALRAGQAGRAGAAATGSGAEARHRARGRPAGTVRGEPRRGARLDLIETLRAAAPWQRLRGRDGAARVRVLRDDFRITRFKQRRETTTVFVVDASGSAALHRLAEAKGAVELLLADCYIRRDRVALIAFRGSAAELLLPPTRSLTRAKRSLAALPGGGGTPLASAIESAEALSVQTTRAGGTAVLVFLTDGRANVGRDGRGGREEAARDALAAARRLRHTGASTLLIDISPRPGEAASALAAAMSARYLRLPAADAATISRVVGREVAGAAR